MGYIFKYLRDDLMFYLETDNLFVGGSITVLLFLCVSLIIILMIKQIRSLRKLKRSNEKKIREIDKMWISMLKKQDKNQNIKNY